MQKIVIYCKTYSRDLDRIKFLVDSIKKYNKDNIPFYISIPKSEENLFKNNLDIDYVNIVFDEDIFPIDTQNWYTQQVVKSSFWKLGLCENYLMIDSDSYFIKDFYISDFMYDDTTPYTVMHEQKNLFEWSSKYKEFIGFNPKESFQTDRGKVMHIFGRTGRFFDFGPSPVIWSSKVWRGLEDNYLSPNNINFSNLISNVASEFTWYGEFLLKSRMIEIIPIEPLFKVFHYKAQYEFFKQLQYTEKNFSENYMGIVIQSNFSSNSIY